MKLELSDRQVSALCYFFDQNIPRGAITKADEATRIVYDVFCVLRRTVAEKSHYPMTDVWRDKPLHACRTEPLARIEP